MKNIFESPLGDRLLEFRSLAQMKTLDTEGLSWNYLMAGDGERTLVLLPGGLGTAEPWFDCMMDWAREFRVIALNYPKLNTIQAAVGGIVAILEAEGGEDVTLLGTSLGGEIAQAMLKELPHKIRRVILANTGIADHAYGEKLKRKLPVLKFFRMKIAFALLRIAALSRMVSLLKPYLSADTFDFWKEYATKIVRQDYSPQSMQTQFDLLIDFALHYATTPDEKQNVRMLIVESEDDVYFKAESRAKLRQLYPETEVRSFKSGGHLLAITKRDEYVELVAEFVRK